MAYVQVPTHVNVQMDGLDQGVNLSSALRVVKMAGDVLHKIRVIAVILAVILDFFVKNFDVIVVCMVEPVLVPIPVIAPTPP